jgi:hypothetical protein
MHQLEALVAEKRWDVNRIAAGVDDPLLGCLFILARLHDRAVAASMFPHHLKP